MLTHIDVLLCFVEHGVINFKYSTDPQLLQLIIRGVKYRLITQPCCTGHEGL